MTGEKFAEIVTKRANERVQVKLKNFKNAIRRAFAELTGSDHLLKAGPSKETAANNLILLNMYEGFTLTPNKDWPTILWKREEEKVKDELLSMMDEMQKALLSPGPQVGDCTPAVDADEGKAEE